MTITGLPEPVPPPVPQGRSWMRQRIRNATEIAGRNTNGLGVWILSILATIAAPCLPMFIEFLSTGVVKPNSCFITAAVLSAAFAVSTQNTLFRSLYVALFVINLILDTVNGPFSASIEHHAWILLVSAASLHAVERFWWHVIYDRPFP